MSFHFHKLRRRRLAEAQKKAQIVEAEPAKAAEAPEERPVKKGRVRKNG